MIHFVIFFLQNQRRAFDLLGLKKSLYDAYNL